MYGSKGLLYIIADKNVDLTSVNYAIPVFSNMNDYNHLKETNKVKTAKLKKHLDIGAHKLEPINEVDETKGLHNQPTILIDKKTTLPELTQPTLINENEEIFAYKSKTKV